MSSPRSPLQHGRTAQLRATGVTASSHCEASPITETPKIDGTNVYMFQSCEPGCAGCTTFIANHIPIHAPHGGPNHSTMNPDAIYEIHNDGDAIEDVTFHFDCGNTLSGDTRIALEIGEGTVAIPLRHASQLTAGQGGTAARNAFEGYTLSRTDGDRRTAITKADGSPCFTKPIDHVGTKTLPNDETYANQVTHDVDLSCDDGRQGRVFAGQRAEAFDVNLGQIFNPVNFVLLEGAIEQDYAADHDLAGKANVTSISFEVPSHCVKGDSPIIGGWTTASLPQGQVEPPLPGDENDSVFGGAWIQQSHLSAPLANELVIGLPDKNRFNAAEPMIDSALANYVTNPTLPALLDILFGDAFAAQADGGTITPVDLPRPDLVAAFLTSCPGLDQPEGVQLAEMTRLNTAVPAVGRANQQPLEVTAGNMAGFLDGRRPGGRQGRHRAARGHGGALPSCSGGQCAGGRPEPREPELLHARPGPGGRRALHRWRAAQRVGPEQRLPLSQHAAARCRRLTEATPVTTNPEEENDQCPSKLYFWVSA